MTKTIRSSGHEALCEALIAARMTAGLTQAQLADRLRCHQSFVARLESGQRRIDAIELIVIARALNADAHAFLNVTEQHTELDHEL
ncbi:helix-turn-helix domain-containing protein [Puniceibacterium sp. IMCC21224]|uniref:helix-turn-helix domain-containing protein n=1 Tax=Puniceibacterium sp. IMCC21224 TaxID=1618204 RepID=UPI0009E472D4|nr:helix-turn-helix transcriptional regulator [Puniceibacterium sp. IMCC21224]